MLECPAETGDIRGPEPHFLWAPKNMDSLVRRHDRLDDVPRSVRRAVVDDDEIEAGVLRADAVDEPGAVFALVIGRHDDEGARYDWRARRDRCRRILWRLRSHQ